ncbi:4-coumarate--CoA ligase 5-like protein [Tanacetum coccineum]|uniref:4-coumarate--CoA ligase 5-like protein n=1 Tax=Tanacetum coccineum TaxID=301880 RepID=A0ABQ5AHZ9_9ASTR
MIEGDLRFLQAAAKAHSGLVGELYTCMQKRIVFFAEANEHGDQPMLNIQVDVSTPVEFAHRMALISYDIYKSAVENFGGDYMNTAKANSLCLNSLQRYEEIAVLVQRASLVTCLHCCNVELVAISIELMPSLLSEEKAYYHQLKMILSSWRIRHLQAMRTLAQLEDGVAPCEAQMESWKTNLSIMVSKERKSLQQYSNYKSSVLHSQPKLTVGTPAYTVGNTFLTPGNEGRRLMPSLLPLGRLDLVAMFGTTTVLMQRFDFQGMLEAIQSYKFNGIPVVPPGILGLVKYNGGGYDLSLLRSVVGIKALTESCGAAGELPFSSRVKIVTPPAGELCLKGPAVMKGYLGNEAATHATMVNDGWLRTGDICYFDADGYLFIVDRIKELSKHEGYQLCNSTSLLMCL